MDKIKQLVKLENITKSFADNNVLNGINLELYEGEVIALVGGNGAGKSTLMKILMGIHTCDSGKILINEEKVNLSSTNESLKYGIYLVPQEPMLFPNMTVEENILIGFDVNKIELKKKLINLIKELKWNIDLNQIAETLSIAQQQLIEILRGLLREAKILILYEPTSTLTFNEIESLFKLIKDLRNQGIGMFYITHRLTEIFDIATDVVILRDGCITLSSKVENVTKEMLIEGLLPPNNQKIHKNNKKCEYKELDYKNLKPTISLENVTGYGFRNINMKIYPGEIVAIAGVVGAGRTELAEAIFGIDKITSGNVYIHGEEITNLKTSEIIKKGINYIPEDRRLNGIFEIGDVSQNISASSLKGMSKYFTKNEKESKLSKKYIDDLGIKVQSGNQLLKSLSGGNQQKVVIGKVLATDPKVIILDEPTRGIDASARGDVYEIIHELKKQGKAILLISSDLEEVLELCDRAYIMYSGCINKHYNRSEITLDDLMSSSYGINNGEVN